MSAIFIVTLVCSHNESYSKEIVRAFPTKEGADAHATINNHIVKKAAEACELYNNKAREWSDENPYPSGATSAYVTAKEAYRNEQQDRLYHTEYTDFEARSEELDRLEKVWEEEHKHLHWSTIEKNWRMSFITWRDNNPEYQAYMHAMFPLHERFSACTSYEPCYMRFHVEPCDMEEV